MATDERFACLRELASFVVRFEQLDLYYCCVPCKTTSFHSMEVIENEGGKVSLVSSRMFSSFSFNFIHVAQFFSPKLRRHFPLHNDKIFITLKKILLNIYNGSRNLTIIVFIECIYLETRA